MVIRLNRLPLCAARREANSQSLSQRLHAAVNQIS